MVGHYKGHAPGTPAPKSEDELRHAEKVHYVFHNQDLIKQLRAKLEHRDRVEALAEGTGIDDAKLLDRLAAQGIDGETVEVLHLVPLIAVAWADGEIQPEEAALLRDAAQRRGLNPAAMARFDAFLETAPRPALVDSALDFIRALLAASDDDTAEAAVEGMTDLALKVASAAGGVFGLFGRVEIEEKDALTHLAQRIAKDHPEAAASLLARL